MKTKAILSIVAFLFVAMPFHVGAQEYKMNVEKTDGQRVTFPTKIVRQISISAEENAENSTLEGAITGQWKRQSGGFLLHAETDHAKARLVYGDCSFNDDGTCTLDGRSATYVVKGNSIWLYMVLAEYDSTYYYSAKLKYRLTDNTLIIGGLVLKK